MVDYSRQINESGSDQIINNSRVRANTASTNAQGVLWMQGTGVPTSINATTAQTLTAAQIGGGLIVHNPGTTAVTDTLDTATNILNYMNANSAGVSVGDIISFYLGNGGTTTGIITLAAGSGGALDTNAGAAIGPGTSRTVNIRITNVTTPAYVVYA